MTNFRTTKVIYCSIFAILALTIPASAVTSVTTRHKSAADLLKGETDNVVIDSEGTIKLARQSKNVELGDLLKDVWSINAVVITTEGTVYLGTSPNGEIIQLLNDANEIIYPEPQIDISPPATDPNDPNSPTQDTIKNEHIFAMALDSDSRLLAGVSGADCRLIRLENDRFETIFQPQDANYIFDIVLDNAGNIYIATGPNGIIYRLTPDAKKPAVVYDALDNNILTLAIDKNNFIYAGSDERGLIYKIHPFDQTATILYDTEQNEVTDLLFDNEGNLYATATNAQSVSSQTRAAGIANTSKPGRPDTESSAEKTSDTQLKTANTDEKSKASDADTPSQPERGASTKSAGYIYRITPEGFVTDIFNDMAIFFAIAWENSDLILATGNNARLFAINPQTEKKTLAFEDDQAAQITALAKTDDTLYIGTANPAKLILLSKELASEGTFTSSLVDATQPARWGKLQIDADIPDNCQILLAARSGNVDDPNDPTFSDWTKNQPITDATQLECPVGRFCQYKLTMTTTDPAKTPRVREIAIPHVVPNLAPKITSIKANRSKDSKKPSIFKIDFKAKDGNKDTLIYEIQFRRLGRTRWIKLKDKLDKSTFEWNTNSVEDARYEVRVTANDRKSNTSQTALTGSRISDPFVIDNTPPKITSKEIEIDNDTVTLNLTIQDEFTAIGNLSYTINSNEDWISTLPNDLVYDTTTEEFTLQIEDLETGEHVIAVKISDDIKNTAYKTFDVNIK